MADLGGSVPELDASMDLEVPPQEPMGLKDLSQELFNKIAVKLDPKSLLRLKATCRVLHNKCFIAQRLITIPLDSVEYTNVKDFEERRPDYRPRPDFPERRPFLAFHRSSLTYLDEYFFRTGFSFHAEEFHTILPLTTEDIIYLAKILYGRVTVTKLRVGCSPTAMPAAFSALLKVLDTSDLRMTAVLPTSYFDVVEFRKLKSLYYPRTFKNSLRYLLVSTFHTFLVDLERRKGRDDSGVIHDVLRKWMERKKEIRDYTLRNFNFNEEALFRSWQIVDDEKKAPKGCTVVVRESQLLFRMIRSPDSAVLYIRFFCDQIMISATQLKSLDWD